MARFTTEDAARLISKMRVNFGKRFADQWAGVEPDELEREMVDQYQGLTSADFLRGIERMKKEKWPPSIPEFRQWCESEHSAYKGKFAALANIEAWLCDRTVQITNAEKEAYNAVYSMFDQLKYCSNYEKQKFYAYEAFKDAYVEVVKDLLEKGIQQHIWVSPVAIDRKPEKEKEPVLTEEEKQKNAESAQFYLNQLRTLVRKGSRT